MSVRDIVVSEIVRVASEQKKKLTILDDRVELVSTGLDSLCFAILVVRLEDRFGVDPFSDESIQLPVTLGDFVKLYQRVASAPIAASSGESGLS